MAWAAVRGMFACAIGWCGQRRSAAEDHAASPTIAVCRRRTMPRRHAALLRPAVRGAFPVERGAGPRGSSAGRGRTRRGRPAGHVHGGARDRRFSRGQIEAQAGTFAGWLYVSRRPSGVRSLWDEVQVRGGRPPGEGARGENGRVVMSAGEHGSAAEKREKLREQGARRVLKLNDDCMCRPVGRTDRRLTREAQGTTWGIVLRGREHAARAAGWDVRGGARVGRGEEGAVSAVSRVSMLSMVSMPSIFSTMSSALTM